MLAIAGAIVPIFLLILLGYALKRMGFPGDGFWGPAERMAYYVFLPALIIRNLAAADLAVLPIGRFGLTIFVVSIAISLITLASRPLLRIDGSGFSSVLQGAVRMNSYVGLAVAQALFGAEGLVVGAFFIAIAMPILNVICIAGLATFAQKGKADYSSVPKQIVQNPIIVGCALGWVLNVAGLPIPDVLNSVLVILERATLPVALLCVGAGLILGLGRARIAAIFATCGLKLLIMPALGVGAALLLGMTGVPFAVIVLFTATPASATSYVLASQMGGDAPLMAGILTAETILAALTIPPILLWATTMAT
jgi:malonate transporter